jgi:hypothetical protein
MRLTNGVVIGPPIDPLGRSPIVTMRLGTLFVMAAFIAVAWGTAGALQLRSIGHGGYATGWGATVTEVEENGPAESAGLDVGDRILAVGGNWVKEPWTRPELAAVAAGDVQSLLVERAGVTEPIDVIWQERSRTRWRSFLVDSLVTLAFLGFGLWSLLASGSAAGLVLAVFGLCYALANLRAPSLGSADVVVRFVQQDLGVLSTALLFHFYAVFPVRKKVAGRPVAWWMVYVPFLPFVLYGLAEWALFPSSLDGYRAVATATDLAYMLLAVVVLLHTWISLSGDERRRTGFDRILWGLAIALGPLVVLGFLRPVLPADLLPAAEYLPLLGVVLPGSMASAVVTGSRAAHAAVGTTVPA